MELFNPGWSRFGVACDEDDGEGDSSANKELFITAASRFKFEAEAAGAASSLKTLLFITATSRFWWGAVAALEKAELSRDCAAIIG